MIRIALVEDHPAIAEGLAALISQQSDMKVVGMAGSAQAARSLIDQETPDVILCDIRLVDAADGLGLLAENGGRGAFLMLSSYSLPSYSARAMELGAKGFLSKLSTIGEIVRAIRTVAAGGTAYPADVRRLMRTALRRPTTRELEILGLLAAGHGNVEIARQLNVRVKTVESQLRRLFDRYDVSSRSSLVHLARLQGWLDA
jgi:DNA-binding NarL/FixJ family response regulator